MTAGTITTDTRLPERFSRHPQVRSVVDVYAVRDCGGSAELAEAVEFIARAPAVSLNRWMAKIGRAIPVEFILMVIVDLAAQVAATSARKEVK